MSKKIRLAIDCTNMVHSKVGGFENYLFNLLDSFVNKKELIITLYVKESQNQYFSKYNKNFSIKRVKLDSNILRFLWFNLILPISAINFDIFFFPANFRPFFVPIKTLTVIHDLQFLYLPQYWNLLNFYFRKIFIRFSVHKSTTLVASSLDTKREIQEHYKVNNIHVIYIPISIICNHRAEANVPKRKYFLIPSSLAPHKNINNLVKAIDSNEFIDYDFLFIGSFNKNDFNYKFDSLNIKILGFVSEANKNKLFKEANGIILPSTYEGFGMPYIEAALFRKNIIASDIFIAREMLKNNAIFIENPFDEEKITIAIKKLISLNKNLISDKLYLDLKEKTDPLIISNLNIDLIKRTVNK